ADNGTVTVVDAAAGQALREIKVGEKPEGVTWIGNGPLAAVTVYREDLVVFFNTADGQIIKKLSVAPEPYGIVANKEGSRVWVTHEYPGTVSEIDVASGGQQAADPKVVRVMAAGSMVRGIALSPDEKRVYVSEFYTAILHALDLQKGTVVDSWKGH